MPLNPDIAISAPQSDFLDSWDANRVLLYHVGLGAGDRPTDPAELAYVNERRLKVLPTFSVIPGFEAVRPAMQGPGLDYKISRMLHGEQDLVVHNPLPPEASVVTTPADRGRLRQGQGRSAGAAGADPRRPTGRCSAPTASGCSSGGRAASAATAVRRPSRGRSAAVRRCGRRLRPCRSRPRSTACPATGTPCTSTPTSPPGPASSVPFCTGCARTAWSARPWWTACSMATPARSAAGRPASPAACTRGRPWSYRPGSTTRGFSSRPR